MHLTEEQIQRFLHGELDEPEKQELSLHLAECNACARRLAEAEGEEVAIFGLLHHVDHPTPVIEAETLIAPRRGAYAIWGRRAAGFLVVAAMAGAAYAFPGSPLPAWLNHVAEWITGQTPPTPPAPPAPLPVEPSPTSQPETAGIAVPVHERFSIHFTAEQAEGDVTVSFTDGANAVVRVFGGTATFTTEVDRLTIENSGSTADYEIELPSDAQWVEISVRARPLFLGDGDLRSITGHADGQGRYILSLSPPAPPNN